ncbi:TetR/AcrR family transcriptional regulator [Pararobbsia alpina]|nr:helix-turn-helix domain-containing protein [Pararobbsia alpina]
MNPEDRKAQILEAALKVAREIGDYKVTRELVAKEAGVAPGLVSRYFSDMATLQDEIVIQAAKNRDIRIITVGLLDRHPCRARDCG